MVGWLIFTYLVLFPFGQIIRIGIFHPTDIVSGLFLIFFLFSKFKTPKIYFNLKRFFFVCLFSLVFSLAFFPLEKVGYGALYLLRLTAYSSFFVVLWNFCKENKEIKNKIFNGLLISLIFVAIFGWIQYFFYSDVRGLYEWGWDDHLFRMVGTFLDPGFTGIILVFGFLMSLSKKNLFLILFFLVSIAFTYSRGAYLALIAGSLVYFVMKRQIKELLFVIFIFGSLVIFLPRPAGEGVKLERTSSIQSRLSNYFETLNLIKKSPIFGVGFNNICFAKEKFLGEVDTSSHSCSGADSSLLFIVATVGTVGFLVFIDLVIGALRNASYNTTSNSLLFISSLVAILVDSLFINSLFYPWVMGYLALISATTQT